VAYTERYCRPELVGFVDARSDWYALGVVILDVLVSGLAVALWCVSGWSTDLWPYPTLAGLPLWQRYSSLGGSTRDRLKVLAASLMDEDAAVQQSAIAPLVQSGEW
jgi:hypothetical protein